MDLAALTLAIDSSSVVQATNDLERFAAASTKAATSGGGGGSVGKMAQDFGRAADKAGEFSNAAARAAASAQSAAKAASSASSSVINFGGGIDLLTGKLNSNFVAINRNIAAWDRQGVAVNDNARQMRTNTGNIAAQFQDIGVTAAMGMNPLIIGLQQGTQLSAALAQSGGGALATLRAAFASVFSPVALLTIALVAGIAALIQWAGSTDKAASSAYRAENGLKTYTKAMGYTKEEVKKLNSVTVTMGDTVQAVFQVGWARAAEALGISTDAMAAKWGAFLTWLGNATRATIAGVYAAIAGTLDLKQNIINDTMSGDLGWGTFTKGYSQRYAQAQQFLGDVGKQAQVNAQNRQNEMAKGFYDKPKGSGGKTDAEKFQDIVEAGQNAIAAERARAQAVGMTAEAAATLEQKQDLLNSANTAGIKLTDGMRAKIDDLAASYGKLKVAADAAAAIQGVSDSIAAQVVEVNDATNLIGLYGDDLIRARNEMEALTKAQAALPKGETLSIADATRISDDAAKLSRDQVHQLGLKRAEDLRKSVEDTAYAMDLERKGLGLTGEAALRYAFITEQLNNAKRDGVTLSPEYVASIDAAGEAYARQRYAIDQQRRALEDAREVTRGFFSDWINGVREGGNVFKSFADSVINSLNRIIDKLLDRTLDSFLDSMFKQGSNGGFLGGLFGGSAKTPTPPTRAPIFPNALGGIYGTAQHFANGGAFTNSIVNTPTLFRFANGAALGEMGEAGPEAIMPLKRGPNGSLGVQAHGRSKPSVRMGDITNVFRVEGAFTADSMMELVRRGGEATVEQVRRELQSMLLHLDNDGTLI